MRILNEKRYNIGYIVIYSPSSSDELLLNLTQHTISDIYRKMHEKNLLISIQSVIFKIMKH